MAGSSSTGVAGSCPTGTANAWDLEVCRAVHGSAAANGVTVDTASYTDFKGDVIGAVGGGSLPTGAQGVRVIGSKAFDTYFASAAGMSSFTATTPATAVTGTITTLCQPGMGCGLFPITVPYVTSNCDNNGTLTPGQGDWPYLGEADTNGDNEAIVPLCKDKNDDIGGGSAGSVGWLDLSTALGVTTDGTCGNTFRDAILDPCVTSIPFPTWIKTFTGGVGKGGPDIENAINRYHDDVVQIPLFDGTCKVQPSGTNLGDCPAGESGVGTNTWYHVPSFGSFKIGLHLHQRERPQAVRQAIPERPYVVRQRCERLPQGLVGRWPCLGPGAIDLGDGHGRARRNRLGVQLIR